MEDAGIGTQHLIVTTAHPTTLAIVSLDETGNRSFGFYRNQTADVMLEERDIPLSAVGSCRVFHFGAVSLTDQPSRGATLAAARYAKAHGALISYDPNFRRPLWRDEVEAKQVILEGLALADVVKLSDEELSLLTGTEDVQAGIARLYESNPLKLLAVTLGPKGCVCRAKAGVFSSAAFDVACIDTTGAGDAFWGACLSWILSRGKDIDDCTGAEIAALMDYANAAGSLSTSRKGAIPAMPDGAEIEACLKTVPRCAG